MGITCECHMGIAQVSHELLPQSARALTKPTFLSSPQEYNSWCVIDESLTLEPSEIRTFTFSFPAAQAAMGDTLEVIDPYHYDVMGRGGGKSRH